MRRRAIPTVDRGGLHMGSAVAGPIPDSRRPTGSVRTGRAQGPESVDGPHGGLEGLNVADDFFPLWELCLPENREALERADFASIQARRGPDWTVEPPIHRRASAPRYGSSGVAG